MQQLVIKLSPELTQKYLTAVKIKAEVEASRDMEVSGVSLDLKLSLIPGLDLLDQIKVNGKDMTCNSDDVVIDFEESA